LNYDTQIQLWSLLINIQTVQQKNGTKFEENSAERIGQYPLEKIREIIATYSIMIDDESLKQV